MFFFFKSQPLQTREVHTIHFPDNSKTCSITLAVPGSVILSSNLRLVITYTVFAKFMTESKAKENSKNNVKEIKEIFWLN